MNNKVLIKLFVPELDITYDVFIPVNEVVWKIKKMLVKSIADLSGIELDINDNYVIFNKIDEYVYNNNEIIIDTNIRNGSEIVLIYNN